MYPFAGDTYGDGIDSDCDGLNCEAASDGNTYFAWCIDQANSMVEFNTLCQDSDYDGLATILTSSENQFVYSLNSPGGAPLIGLNDIGTENQWEWLSSLQSSYEN